MGWSSALMKEGEIKERPNKANVSTIGREVKMSYFLLPSVCVCVYVFESSHNMCVCVNVSACARTLVRVNTCMCVCACVCGCAHECVPSHACVRVMVSVLFLCV